MLVTTILVSQILGFTEPKKDQTWSYEPFGYVIKTWQKEGHWRGRYCRATLVAPKTFLTTTTGCIESADDCKNSKALLWDEIGGAVDAFDSRRTFKCDRILLLDKTHHQVLFTTQESTDDLDLVLLPEERRSEFVETESVSFVARDRLKGSRDKQKCSVLERYRSNKDKLFDISYRTNCAFQDFNEGSPVLNESDQMTGMLWGAIATRPDDRKTYQPILAPIQEEIFNKIKDLRKSELKPQSSETRPPVQTK